MKLNYLLLYQWRSTYVWSIIPDFYEDNYEILYNRLCQHAILVKVNFVIFPHILVTAAPTNASQANATTVSPTVPITNGTASVSLNIGLSID